MEDRRIELEPGNGLLLYTDGLSEAFSSGGDFFGEERIIAALHAAGDKSAEKILQHIEVDLEEFVGEEAQSDDLTMLILKRD